MPVSKIYLLNFDNTITIDSGTGTDFLGLLPLTGVLEFSGLTKMYSPSAGRLVIVNSAGTSGALVNLGGISITGNITPGLSGVHNVGEPTNWFGTGYINQIFVQGETYSSAWDSDFTVPTKHDLYTKIETIGGGVTGAIVSGALDTSAELRTLLTDDVGTGFAVFNGSPTLITPVVTGGLILADPIDGGPIRLYARDNILYASLSGSPVTGGNAEFNCEMIRLLEQNDFVSRGELKLEGGIYLLGYAGISDGSVKGKTGYFETLSPYDGAEGNYGSIILADSVYTLYNRTGGRADLNIRSIDAAGTISPTTSGIYDLGASSSAFRNLYIKNIIIPESGSLLTAAHLDTSAKLSSILTDENGSGRIVFNSGATLSIPVISGGTVSALDPYSVSWSGSLSIPSKGDIFSKLESLSGQGPFIDVSKAPWSLRPITGGLGATQADATYNTNMLNAIFNSYSGLGIQTNPRTVYFPGYAYLINDTVVLPSTFGLRILGNGFSFGTQQVFQGLTGAPLSRLIWAGGQNKPMVSYLGYGMVWDGLGLYGKYHTGTFTDLTNDFTSLATSLTGYASIGFQCLVDESDTGFGFGVGKIKFPHMAVHLCQTGIMFGSGTITNTNADEAQFDYLLMSFCRNGFTSYCQNSLGFTFDYVTPYYVAYVFDVQAGGKYDVQHMLSTNVNGGTLFRIGYTNENNGLFRIGELDFDNNYNGSTVLDYTTSGFYRPISMTIEGLHVGYSVPSGTVLFKMRGPVDLTLNNGVNFMSGMVLMTGLFDIHPYLVVNSCRFRAGNHPDTIVKLLTQQSGTGFYTHRDCKRDYYEAPGGFYDTKRWTIVHGAKTSITGA